MPKPRGNPDGLYWGLMADAEAKILNAALRTHRGNVKFAAQMLGISWTHFNRRLRALGLKAINHRTPPKAVVPVTADPEPTTP